jgi:YHS domain-containing protein
MNLSRRTAILAAAATLLATAAFAKSPAIYTENRIAIDGSDTVAYFIQGKPVRGDKSIFVNWNGSKWLFSTPENKAKFEANPEAYAPQYGGYCAFAMAKGAVAPTLPEAWTIVNGKLYLNYSLGIRTKWNSDIPGFIKTADSIWPKPLED